MARSRLFAARRRHGHDQIRSVPGFAARRSALCGDGAQAGAAQMSLLAELKRRNVIRMAGLYLVGSWLIVQVSSTVLPMFDMPAWLPRSIVILLIVGFIPTLVFAWAFELTPEGLKLDSSVKPEESIAPQTARRLDRLLPVAFAVALGYFGFDKFVLAPRRD